MKRLLFAIYYTILNYINGTFEEIAEAIEDDDKPTAIRKSITLLVAALGVVGIFALIIALLYAGREVVLAVVAPIILIAVFVKSYQLNHPSAPTTPVQQPGTIELAKARAEKRYPLLAQTAFFVFTELCHYLPGLVTPFSLSDVIPKVHYEISASFLTTYHFIIAKGDCETNRETLKEILETLLEQHLEARDLPMSIPSNYTSADGEIYPALIIDGVYDLANHYRVDFLITDEAAVARLRAVTGSNATGGGVIIRDEDFD